MMLKDVKSIAIALKRLQDTEPGNYKESVTVPTRPVTIRYKTYNQVAFGAGKTVREVEQFVREMTTMSPTVIPYVDNVRVDENYVLGEDDHVDFVPERVAKTKTYHKKITDYEHTDPYKPLVPRPVKPISNTTKIQKTPPPPKVSKEGCLHPDCVWPFAHSRTLTHIRADTRAIFDDSGYI